MGWKDLLLSPGGAQGTRESVRQQFRRSLQYSTHSTHLRRRIGAAFDTLSLRYRVIRKPQQPDVTAFEALPFGYLDNDFEAERTLAEYVVYQEHPNAADRQFVEEAIWEGLSRLIAADDDDSLTAKTNLREAHPNLRTHILWANWIDLQSFRFEETRFEPFAKIALEGKARREPNEQAQAIASRVRHVAQTLSDGNAIFKTAFLAGYIAGFPNYLEDVHETAGGIMRTMLFDAMWGVEDSGRIFHQLQILAEQDDDQARRGGGFGIPDGERWFSTIARPTGPDDSLESLRSAISLGFVDLARRL